MGKVVFFQKGRAGKVPPRGFTSEQRVWTKPRRDSCTNLGEEHAWHYFLGPGVQLQGHVPAHRVRIIIDLYGGFPKIID